MKTVTQTWQALPSGLLIPTGYVTDTSANSKATYLQIKDKALAVEELFETNGVKIPPTSKLAHLIANAKSLWQNLISDMLSYEMVFQSIHFNRIADAVLPLRHQKYARVYIRKLLRGNLEFFERVPSHAKDFFWEIELWSKLYRKIPQAFLQDPPDIIVPFEDTTIGIVCKNFYSEKHVQEVLSKGVSQVGGSFDFGIVSFNIDDLLPEGVIAKARDDRHLAEILLERNHTFIERHKHHFQRYLTDGRLIAIFVSTTVIADILNATPRLYNASQLNIWSPKGIDERYKRQINRLYDLIMDK
jgi:hypothetical protein